MEKKCNVVMLPTQSKAVRLGQLVIGAGNNLFSSRQSNDIGSLKAYELYITSDEEIKNNDWFYDTRDRIISNNSLAQTLFSKKIIATTDKSLVVNISRPLGVTQELPQPPQEFIKYFIEEYNKGNVITEVMVEYEENHLYPMVQNNNLKLGINPDNTINIKPIKDSWNREEVIILLNKWLSDEDNNDFDQQKWIEENL